MLEQLTIKDFIKYNSPCRCCGDTPYCFFKTSLYFELDRWEGLREDVKEYPVEIIDGIIELPLAINYYSKKSLLIDPITNKYIYNSSFNSKDVLKFFSEYICWMESVCKNCGTRVSSGNFEFKDYYIEPLMLSYESAFVTGSKYKFCIMTYFSSEKETGTDILFYNLKDNFGFEEKNIFNIPEDDYIKVDRMPIGNFKCKEDILSKLEMLITFR